MPFCLFLHSQKHRNLKWNKNEMKQKLNEKNKKLPSLPAAKWSETEAKFFRFNAKKVLFACFCIWSKTKMKWSENETKKKRKRIKWNSGTICKETKKNINPNLGSYINWHCHAARSCIWLLRRTIGERKTLHHATAVVGSSVPSLRKS